MRKSGRSVRSTTDSAKKEIALARRVFFIILTDLCCWMPVIIIGILTLLGKFNDPSKQAYVWIAIFVLPVNSSINPILYTFSRTQVMNWATMKCRKILSYFTLCRYGGVCRKSRFLYLQSRQLRWLPWVFKQRET